VSTPRACHHIFSISKVCSTVIFYSEHIVASGLFESVRVSAWCPPRRILRIWRPILKSPLAAEFTIEHRCSADVWEHSAARVQDLGEALGLLRRQRRRQVGLDLGVLLPLRQRLGLQRRLGRLGLGRVLPLLVAALRKRSLSECVSSHARESTLVCTNVCVCVCVSAYL